MAADQRLQNTVPSIGDQRAIVRVRLVVDLGIVHVAIVESPSISTMIDLGGFFRRHHLPQVPQLHCLVFAVAEYIPPIPFAVDVGETLGVAHEDAGFAAVAHAAPVPDFDKGVVRSRIQDVRR